MNKLLFTLHFIRYCKFEGFYWNDEKKDRQLAVYLDYYDGYWLSVHCYFFSLCFKY